MASADEHVKALLELPPEERERIAYLLLDSLDGGADGELSPEWIAEINRRIAASNNGTSKSIPYEEVRRNVMARLEEVRKRR
jgi:putative addiction module component (TIGR02574 family)